MNRSRHTVAAILATLVFGAGGPVEAQERPTIEIVISPDQTAVDATCYPRTCLAVCRRDQTTLCQLESGRYFRMNQDCSCPETDGTVVDQAMLQTMELLGLLGPVPTERPGEGLQLNPFPGITRESIRTIQMEETDMVPQFEGQVDE